MTEFYKQNGISEKVREYVSPTGHYLRGWIQEAAGARREYRPDEGLLRPAGQVLPAGPQTPGFWTMPTVGTPPSNAPWRARL